MDDLDSVDTQGDVAPVEETQSTSAEGDQQVVVPDPNESGGNPAWEGIRNKLDPMLFKSIEEDLKGFDKNAQSKIESLNKQYSPYKAFDEQGIDSDQLSQALYLAQQVEANPQEIYEKLGEFLKTTGRLPESKKEVAEALEDDYSGDEEQDPRLTKLEEQQQKMEAFLERQAQEEVRSQADKALNKEIDTLRKTHPEMTDEDLEEVISRAATKGFLNQQKGLNKVPKLEDEYNSVVQYRNSILQAARSGDSAPRLIPTSGGVATSSGEKKTLGQLTSNESADLLAGLIAKDSN